MERLNIKERVIYCEESIGLSEVGYVNVLEKGIDAWVAIFGHAWEQRRRNDQVAKKFEHKGLLPSSKSFILLYVSARQSLQRKPHHYCF